MRRYSPWMALLLGFALLLTACGGSKGGAPATGGGEGGSKAATGQVQGVTDTEIVIGAFGPLTGPASWIGLGTRDGFQMGIDEINAKGGVNGRKIKVVYLDDAFQVAQGQTVVRKLLNDTKPFMIYSGTGSTVFVAVQDVLRDSGLPIYNGFSGSPAGRKDPEVPNMFHGQAVVGTQTVVDLGDLVDKLGIKRVAVMNDVDEWGRSVCEPSVQMLEKKGLKPLTVQHYKAGDTDYNGQLVAIKNANPQMVVNCGHFPEATIILQQARSIGIKAIFVGDTAQANPSVWERGGKAADNFIFNWYSPVFLSDKTGPMADFMKKYKEKYPNAPTGRPSHSDTFAYGDAYIIAKALQDAGKDLTQDKFIKAMHAISNFQPTPINAVANFNNSKNDGFTKTLWMVVNDGNTAVVDATQEKRLAQIVAGL